MSSKKHTQNRIGLRFLLQVTNALETNYNISFILYRTHTNFSFYAGLVFYDDSDASRSDYDSDTDRRRGLNDSENDSELELKVRIFSPVEAYTSCLLKDLVMIFNYFHRLL